MIYIKKEKALYSETVFKALDKCKSRKNYKIWENPKLDIISCTMEYLKKIKIIRTEKKQLFMSFIQPHKAVKYNRKMVEKLFGTVNNKCLSF